MALIKTLTILARADISALEKGLKKVDVLVQQFATGIQGIGTAMVGVGALLAGGGALAGFTAFVKSGLDSMNELRKESEKLGVSNKSFSELAYTAKLADVDL